VQEFVGTEGVVLGNAPGEIAHAHALVARTDAIAPVITGGEVAAKADQRRFERFGESDSVGVEAIESIGGHERELIHIDVFVAFELHDEVGGIEAVQFSRRHFEVESVLRPVVCGCVDVSAGEDGVAIVRAQRDGEAGGAADVTRVQAALVSEGAMDRQPHLLANARGLAGYAEDAERHPGIGGVAGAELIAIALRGIQRLPGKREIELGSAREGGPLFDHLTDVVRIPETHFETGVLKDLGPEAVVGGIADGFEKGAEDGARNGGACGASGVDVNGSDGRYGLVDDDLRGEGERQGEKRKDGERGGGCWASRAS